MITISIATEKGGVGKTTTAQALGEALRERGYKVLLVDLDTQASLSFCLDIEKAKYSVWDFVYSCESTKKALTDYIYKDALKANEDLVKLEQQPSTALADALELVKNNYDFCIIDTSPKLDKLFIKALMCSQYVIIPTRAEVLSVKGVEKTLISYNAVKDLISAKNRKAIKIAGILLTFYNEKLLLNSQIKELLELRAGQEKTKLFKATIRQSTIAGKAQALKKEIINYSPKAKIAEDYRAFALELLEDLGLSATKPTKTTKSK